MSASLRMLLMTRLLISAIAVALALALPAIARAAMPPVDLTQLPAGLAGARVPPNLLLDLSLTDSAVAAAYPGAADYARATAYPGYFNPRLCYDYPLRRKAGTQIDEPDLRDATGYFSAVKPADAAHECGGDAFSGNFLNWASASVLDIVRYGLTGGDRVIDEAGRTVLQRAYLPQGAPNADFYAHSVYFPRKVLTASATGSAPLGVTPFDVPTLYIVSCRNRILFSDSQDGGDCDTPRLSGKTLAHSDKYLGEYLARVRVCEAVEGSGSFARLDLCLPYGRRYKPAGSVQRQAGALRVGLATYLTEYGADDLNLYGGALRAPLEHVGPLRYDGPDFTASVNADMAWSAATGVLPLHPGGTAGIDGLLNTINLLGRAKPARSGIYRAAGPLAELYYESLRYLQGRQPSPGAPVPGASDDGLPVLQPWRDPVTAPCQRNVIVTIGNADAAGDRYVPGNTRTDHVDAARAADPSGAPPGLDVMDATRRVGAFEADPGAVYGNGAPRPHLAGLELQDTGAAGLGTYYAAGLAYWAHVNPVRLDQPVRVDNHVIDLDSGGNGLPGDSNPRNSAGNPRPRDSALYLVAKYGAFHDRNQDGNPFQSVVPGSAKKRRLDSEWSVDGSDPRHYFMGSEPVALLAAIRSVFADASSGASAAPGPVPGLALLATRTPGQETLFFQAGFDPSDGSGSLVRLPLAKDAEGRINIGEPLWEAGALLTAGASAQTARPIYTLSDEAGQAPKTVAFEWAALSSAQRALLDRPPAAGEADANAAAPAADGLGAARLAYLRGDRTREAGRPGGIFRRRASLLGDVVHSAPVHVGAPSKNVQGAGYDAFYQANAGRRAAVYLGANDGMLHAFDAASGAELFAYVPNALIGALNQLPSPAHGHRPYVDGAAAAGEALLAGGWKTVLVSAMGGGAQGVFALDVTDPAGFHNSGALWEFTDADDAAIGNVRAAPAIAKLRTGIENGLPVYRYFVVVASGFNNYVDDGPGRFTRNGAGALFLLALDKPKAAPWQLGTNYYKFTMPASDSNAANALAPPALVAGGDGALRYAYAGDLQGNLWRIDFTGKAPWANNVGPGSGKRPLFVARDGAGARQPITGQVKVVYAPGGGHLILFGTGKLVEHADLLASAFRPQSFYAIRDTLADPPALVSGRAALAARTLDASAVGLALSGAPLLHLGADAKSGWYLDFSQAQTTGERSVGGAALAAGKVFFNTTLPGGDACAAPRTRSYAIDALTGLAIDDEGQAKSGAVTGQLSDEHWRGPPVVIDMASVAGARNATGRAVVTKHYVVFNLGRNGPQQAPKAGPGKSRLTLPARRMSWREVANWRELHEAAVKAAKK